MEKILVDCRKRWERIIVVIHRYVPFIEEDEKKIFDYIKIDNVKGLFLILCLSPFPNESNYIGFILISQIKYFFLEKLLDKIIEIVDSGSLLTRI